MTDRTLTALYTDRASAERARQQLRAAGYDHGVDIHDQQQAGSDESADHGILGKLKSFFGDHEDSHSYGEGLKRGHVLLTANVDDDDADAVSQLLESTDAVDFDQTQAGWRTEGWTAPAASTGAYGAAAGMGAGAPAIETERTSAYAADLTADRTGAEEVIPIVEERLRVGKREVERGGVRVRSYVVETPVQEQIGLREERVTLERRPVDRALSATDAAFQDRNIEMTETAEEAVVAKDAVVREELVVRKDASERVEEINDTVRRTEVEVDDTTRRADGLPRQA